VFHRLNTVARFCTVQPQLLNIQWLNYAGGGNNVKLVFQTELSGAS
jgi:hypothetical protein